jgi:hypothetical protein
MSKNTDVILNLKALYAQICKCFKIDLTLDAIIFEDTDKFSN